MEVSNLAVDATAGVTAFAATHFLYGATKNALRKRLSTWDKVRSETQNRMACEIALLPCRLAIFICTLPIVLNSFLPTASWTEADTMRSILACSIMAGCYCYDLLIERNDVLSLIHHFMGPGMLIWIRCSFASGTSDDAVMNRLLISFVFFGAALGGSTTTCILVLMKLFKHHMTTETMYRYVSKLGWCLMINTMIATTFGMLYMHYWFDDLMAYWHNLAFIPLGLSGFEFYLQWRWAFRFQNIQDDLWAKGAKQSPKVDLMELMRNKYLVLRSIVSVWMVCYMGVWGKVGGHAAASMW